MHKSCITKWKQKTAGLDGIKLLSRSLEQRDVVITWLQTKEYINIDELFTYLDERYDVTYQSKQSYYELLAANSWKKKSEGQGSIQLVKKREEIVDFLSQHSSEIKTGQLLCFCRRVSSDGDVCGYV